MLPIAIIWICLPLNSLLRLLASLLLLKSSLSGVAWTPAAVFSLASRRRLKRLAVAFSPCSRSASYISDARLELVEREERLPSDSRFETVNDITRGKFLYGLPDQKGIIPSFLVRLSGSAPLKMHSSQSGGTIIRCMLIVCLCLVPLCELFNEELRYPF